MKGLNIFGVVTLIAAAGFFPNQRLEAGGYEWFGLGSRASAMGGAFIGLADDWTAAYWNPAGLAQLEGEGAGVNFLSPHPTLKGSNSFANLASDNPNIANYKFTKDMFIDYSGVEPDKFNKTSTTYHFYHAQGAGSYVTLPEFTLGLAIYSPLGYYSDWNDTIPYGMGTGGSIYGKNYQELAIVETQLTIAREIIPGLYAGAGVALLYDRLERKSTKIVENSHILDYRYAYSIKDDGFGAEGMAGLLYRISDLVSVGGVYRTGATVKMTGKASASLDFMGVNESTHNTYRFRQPPTWGIGVAVKAIPDRLTLTADFQQTLWSFYRTNVQYNQEGMFLQSSSYDEDWRDSNRYRVGAEYRLKPEWALRAGFAYDESPLPDKSVSLAHIPDVNRNNVTLGTGFKVVEDLAIDILGAYGWGDRTAEGARYKQRVWGVGLDLIYLF
jgi:long-chain fatty acid transport protein